MNKSKEEKEKIYAEFNLQFYCTKLYAVLLTIYFIFFVGGIIGYFSRYTLLVIIPLMLWQWYLLHKMNLSLSKLFSDNVENNP